MRKKNNILVQRVETIRGVCAGKSVLHLGCANFPYTRDSIENKMLLHFDLEEVCSEVFGIDYDTEGLAIVAENGCENLFQADLERLQDLDLTKTFDVIVAGEIVEHLNNPGLFLSGIQRFMTLESRLMITTVNAYCGMRFFRYAIRGKKGRAEPVHPDHVAYYSYSTLTQLLNRHGFEIDRFYFYDLGPEHRPYSRRLVNLINGVCVKFSPQLADGLIAIARLRTPSETEAGNV